jgi:hypothetical protein
MLQMSTTKVIRPDKYYLFASQRAAALADAYKNLTPSDFKYLQMCLLMYPHLIRLVGWLAQETFNDADIPSMRNEAKDLIGKINQHLQLQ